MLKETLNILKKEKVISNTKVTKKEKVNNQTTYDIEILDKINALEKKLDSIAFSLKTKKQNTIGFISLGESGEIMGQPGYQTNIGSPSSTRGVPLSYMDTTPTRSFVSTPKNSWSTRTTPFSTPVKPRDGKTRKKSKKSNLKKKSRKSRRRWSKRM